MLNLIFDLGGVVVRWDPAAIIASVFDDEDLRARVREGVFAHPDWLELDRGTLDAITIAHPHVQEVLEEFHRKRMKAK